MHLPGKKYAMICIVCRNHRMECSSPITNEFTPLFKSLVLSELFNKSVEKAIACNPIQNPEDDGANGHLLKVIVHS